MTTINCPIISFVFVICNCEITKCQDKFQLSGGGGVGGG